MKKKETGSGKSIKLRKKTEVLLSKSPSVIKRMSSNDVRDLLEDLKIYQVELEMQNQKLERVQGELEIARDRYHGLYDFAPVAYFTINQKGIILETNLTGVSMLDVEKGVLIGSPFSGFLTEDSRGIFRSHQKKVLETGTRQACELKALKKDGLPFFVRIESTVFGDRTDDSAQFRTVVSDIDKDRRAGEALLESEGRYRTLFQDSREAKSLTQNGKIVEVNPKWLELHGFNDRDEVVGNDVLDFIHPEDKKILTERRRKWPKKMEGVYELRDVRNDGSMVDVEVYSSRILLEGKETILATIHDITARKQTQEALRESEEKYRTLVETLADIVLTVDPNGKITYLNHEFEKICRYRMRDLVGRHFTRILASEFKESTVDFFNRGMSDEEFPLREIAFVDRDGKHVPIEIRMTKLLGADRESAGWIGVARDISDRKKLEAKLLEAHKMEALGTLAGGIAHQFNNALTSITGHTSLLQRELPDDERTMGYLASMKASADRMAHLTTQLLAYAREGKYNPQPMSLSNFVEDTLPLIKHIIYSPIVVETNLATDILEVEADRTQMQMVLSAIMANANEAIDGQGRIRIITRNVKVDDAFQKDHPELKPGSYACLSIEDDGRGMDGDTKNRIFDPFFITHFFGRGLGMAAVHGFVMSHNGWISVDSELGKGTVVHLYLPAIESEEKIVGKAAPEPKGKAVKGEETILVIEDEEDVMRVIRSTLERLGYRVLEARTGIEAVDLAETFDGDIHLAILDVMLPDMAGKVVYHFMKKARPNLKTIVCSGYAIDGPPKEILDAGADAFIQKPSLIPNMSEKLKEVLEGK